MLIREVVRSIYSATPPRLRSASAFSRLIGVERTVVQRLFSAGLTDEIDETILARVPGPKALFAIAEAIRGAELPMTESSLAHGMTPEELAKDVESIAIKLESLFAAAGGTQRAFAQKILIGDVATESNPPAMPIAANPGFVIPTDPHDPDLARRAVIFDAARDLVGRSSKAQVQMLIYGLSQTPDMLDIVRVRGMTGHVGCDTAVPLMFMHQRRGDFVSGDDNTYQNLGTKNGLLEQFCSAPLPNLATTLAEGISLTTATAATSAPNSPFDIFLADRTDACLNMPHVRASAWVVDEVFSEIDYPAESLILDVYQPKSLARLAVPGLDVHIARVGMQFLRGTRWTTRLHSSPKLQIITPIGDGARSAHYARMPELTADIFARAGWNPADFVGYRCEVRYPAWRLAYRVFLEYGSTETGADSTS